MLLLAVTLGALALPSVVQGAVPQGAHVVKSNCTTDWYVNADELDLLPVQTPAGFVFDGPSLVHRLLAVPVPLATAPLNGAFTATLETGVMPLFKMETTAPYSTINKTPDGKFWSSKIASGLGSQAQPMDTIAALGTQAPYTIDSKVYSFGVGYANDKGNKAVVTSVTFGASKFDLTCVPKPSASASVSPSVSVRPTSPAPVASLPVTGTETWKIVLAGLLVLGAGVALVVVARRRRFN